MKILLAGVGNVLRADDGFGIKVVQELALSGALPAGVRLYEAGIAGIGLVQELMDGYEVLIIVDAVERGARPGAVFTLVPRIPELDEIDANQFHQSLADAHYTEPAKVLLLARALKVYPSQVFIVGCQPLCCDEAVMEMSAPVQRAVPLAVEQILALVKSLQQPSARPQI